MNYAYDIYINLNNKLYDFFDWNKNDKLIHIKKIPIIKIEEEVFKKFISCKIYIDNNELLKIYNKAEIWDLNAKIQYCCVFTDNYNAVCIEFDSKGISQKKSYLSINDELEIIEMSKRFETQKIIYKIISNNNHILKTRKQIKDEKFVCNELKNMEESKLSYIYFECFGIQEKDKDMMINKINKISKNSKIYKNLYDILKLTSSTKK